jgi:cold shock protein
VKRCLGPCQVRGTSGAVYLRINLETDNGTGHSEVVQFAEGIRVHPATGWGKDVFVHISAVEKAGLISLNEGQAIEYEEITNRGKTSAENLKVQR